MWYRTTEKAYAGLAKNRIKRWIRQISVSMKAIPMSPKYSKNHDEEARPVFLSGRAMRTRPSSKA